MTTGTGENRSGNVDVVRAVDRLRHFFTLRGVSSECPACKHTSWSVAVEGGLTAALIMTNEAAETTLPTPVLPTYTLACNNCGFLRSHAKAIVDRET